MDWPELTIGEVARKAGVATSSIRYYESIGLLPEPDRCMVSGGTAATCSAGSPLSGSPRAPASSSSEIKDLVDGVDGADGMAGQMRSLSSRKLAEVEALLERTQAMKGWLEVAKECGCETPAECALFPAPGEQPPNAERVPRFVQVDGRDCRRAPADCRDSSRRRLAALPSSRVRSAEARRRAAIGIRVRILPRRSATAAPRSSPLIRCTAGRAAPSDRASAAGPGPPAARAPRRGRPR